MGDLSGGNWLGLGPPSDCSHQDHTKTQKMLVTANDSSLWSDQSFVLGTFYLWHH